MGSVGGKGAMEEEVDGSIGLDVLSNKTRLVVSSIATALRTTVMIGRFLIVVLSQDFCEA